MRLRSSKFIGIPNNSYSMTNMPIQSYGLGQRLMLTACSLLIGSIAMFTYILYILFFLVTEK